MIRKMAGMARPSSEIRVFDGKVHIYTLAMGLFKNEDAFGLNEEFEREHQGLKQKVLNLRFVFSWFQRIDLDPVRILIL